MSTASTPLQCPICADDMSLCANGVPGSRAVRLPCCGHFTCQQCLYRHIQSVFEEGRTGQGRSSLKCPVGCGNDIPDYLVRVIIDRTHSTRFYWRWIGMAISNILRWLQVNEAFRTNARLYLNHSPNARMDLERYEQWSLVVALRKVPTVHCPAPGCDYLWITNDAYRRKKQEHESKPFLLWYEPPKADKNGNFAWVEPEYANLGATGRFVEPDYSDGRRMVCAKCLTIFCGLCRRPWEYGTGRRQLYHRGITCARYRRTLPSDDNEFTFVANQMESRSCPGCSVRTQRTGGCNHMTCPCGYEWCYVCESRWNGMHYSCVDGNARRERATCAIS